LFNYVQSGVIPGGAAAAAATLLDTNMPTAGQLPLRHQMVIFSIGFRFDEADSDTGGQNLEGTTVAANGPDGLTKWQEITNNIWFQFLVENTKPYSEGHVTDYPAGGGLWFLDSGEAASPTNEAYYVCNGEPGAHAARRLAMPIHIGALEQFSGLLRYSRGAITFTDSPDTEYGLTCFLRGPRQRPLG
jgi:hypothetical protein